MTGVYLPEDNVLIFPKSCMPAGQQETLEKILVLMNNYANGMEWEEMEKK